MTGDTHGDRAPLGDLSELAEGDMRVFGEVGEYGIVVCRVDGELYAVEDNCSHADTPLSDGRLRGAMIMCPQHGAAFDVRDGTHQGPPAFEGIRCHRLHGPAREVTVDLTPTTAAQAADRTIGTRIETR